MQELIPFICFKVCGTILSLTLGIVAVFYASEEEDHECQKGTRANLNLSEWLKIRGLLTVCTVILYWIIVILLFCCRRPPQWLKIFEITYVISIGLCDLILGIIGVVILSTNENNNCVAVGASIAIITIIYIVFSCLSLCFRLGVLPILFALGL